MSEQKDIPIWCKMNLTIEEAALYSNIGKDRIRYLTDLPNCDFVIFIGNSKRLIKRKEFEEFNSSINNTTIL